MPLLHIADPTAERIRAQGFGEVGLLGTAFTMEQDFYKGRLAERHGLEVLVPGDEDRALVHHVIYEELVQGRAEPSSRQAYRDVIARLVERGAEAVILGCTEIMLLVGPKQSGATLRHDGPPCRGRGGSGTGGDVTGSSLRPVARSRLESQVSGQLTISALNSLNRALQ